MKKPFGILTFMLFLLATSSFIFATNSGEEKAAENPPHDVVAQVFQNGGVHVFEGNLYPFFQSGADIETFAVFQNQSGWILRRRGMENGHSRTEHILLAMRPGTNFLEIQAPVWLTVCEMGCLGCAPNQQNNACDCPGGGNCTFGMLSGDGVQILNP